MTLNSHDNVVLVAPRPVRLAAPAPFSQYHHAAASFLHRPQAINAVRFMSPSADAFDRLKLSDDASDEDPRSETPAPSERDRSVSPRASPRSPLPSEAIEEFLSILRPSSFLFPPTSPILRPGNGAAHGFFPYRRPGSCSLSPVMSNEGLGITLVDQNDNMSKDGDTVAYPFKIISTAHLCVAFLDRRGSRFLPSIFHHTLSASPVARPHTRNPFPRQTAYENPVSAFIREQSPSPSPAAAALSPATIPLPLPTPDEMEFDPVF